MVLRVTLDVNVWVNHYLGLSKGRQGTAAQLVVQSAFAGHCRLGPLQPVISHVMLDTLQEVLVRIGLAPIIADAARDAIEASAAGGVLSEPPYVVLGGGVQPLMDTEDGGVLDTAIAGRADLLVTNNLADFRPGPKADIDAVTLRVDANGAGDVILFRHGRLPHGLIVTSVFVAKSWLVDGVLPPAGALQQFLPTQPGNGL